MSLFPEIDMKKAARISDCGKYRYTLSRVWDVTKGAACFIMLNPSTADADQDDPTIRRCIGFARDWGYGGLHVANLFAFRATDPKDMLAAPDPTGPENDHWILYVAGISALVICAWGYHGYYRGRGGSVRFLLAGAGIEPHALRMTNTGEPGHPLYIPSDTEPFAIGTIF